jgi:hypothetical protein
MTSTPDDTGPITETDDSGIQPLRDGDTSIPADPDADPAQAEWDRTTLLDEGVSPDEIAALTATGDDPDEIPSDQDEIPFFDRPDADLQPESQGQDPLVIELGEEGEGDLSPEDL